MQEQNDQESSKNLSLKDENTEENSELLSLIAQRERRNEHYAQNSNAWTNKYEPSNLDSNLKKNSSFIKKMKTHLNAENCANLLKEIRTLKLEKYLSEVMASLNEGLVKCKTTANVNAAVDVVSALHQRFPDSFTPELMDSIKQQLIPPSKATTNNTNDKEKEDTARISKQKVMLRLATEFWLVGLMENGSSSTSNNLKDEMSTNMGKSSQKISALCPIYDIIKDLLLYDQDTTLGLSLAISFVKQFGVDLLGVVPTNSTIKSENLESQTNESILITPEVQNSFRKLFESYFNRASKRIVNEHKKIQKIEKSNEEQYINRGEITENSKTYFEKAFKAYEKDLSLINTLAELINLPQPILPEDDSTPAQSDSFVTGGDSSRLSAHKLTPTDLGPWDDEESKNFYTDILDIKLMVPGILLEGGSIPVQTASFIEDKQDDSEAENTDTESKSANQGENSSDIAQPDPNAKSSASIDSDPSVNQASSPLPSSNSIKSAQLETLIAKLNNMANRDLVNEIAVEFCYMNTKSNRARLIQALFGVSRLRLDLIPYYCRLLATLNPYFPEITQGVLTSLANEFKSFRRRKATQGYEFRESRIKNIRYISELTKFGLAPPHDAFHCFKVLLEDISNASNLETLCSMLDCCGRFLYKTPDTHERTSAMLEQMAKKKNAMILDPRLNTMIENAYYQVNPPDQPAFQVKVRSDVELFLIHLINEQLDFRSCDRISKILRRFNWEDPKIYNLLFKTFTKIWKVKDSSVALMAILLKGLQTHHSRFVIEVLDQVFEDVILGLEWNDYRYNQRRVYLMKFLGELYNYKILDASTIFEALYTTITFGHENSFPILGNINPIDPPDDFFRIRLVNTILETCGNNLKLKKETSRLQHFIIFFQMYIFTKNELPLEIDFAVSDLFDKLNFGSLRLNTYEEAYQRVNQIIVQDQQVAQRLSSISLKDNESGNISDNENDSQYLEGISSHNSPHLNLSSDDEDLESVNDSASDVYSLSEHDDASDHEDADQQSEDDDLEDFDMINEEEMERKLREEEDEEFDREFNLMMAQSLDSRKYDRKTKLQDIQLPTRLGELKSAKIDPSQNRVAFTVLTKKTGKGQSSSNTISSKFLEVPSECSLAVNTLNRQEQERQEQIQLKKMVLDFEVQQDLQERKDFQQTLARHGVNLTNSSFASPDSSSNGQSAFSANSPGTKYRTNRNFKKI